MVLIMDKKPTYEELEQRIRDLENEKIYRINKTDSGAADVSLLHSVFDEMTAVPIQGYNAKREVIYWNSANEVTYGYTRSEAMGRKLEDLIIPGPMKSHVVQGIKDWHEKGIPIPSGELTLVKKGGEPVHVYSNHVLITNMSGEKEMYCIDVDLNDRIKAEEALKKSEEDYRLLIENQNDLIVKFDKDNKILFASPSFCKTFGVNSKKILGTEYSPPIHEDDRAVVRTSIESLKKPPYNTYHEERAKTVNGWKWFGNYLKAVYDDAENLQYTVAVGRDITKQKQLEARLLHSQKMESIGTLAGGMAHEFNNILSIIMGNNELVDDEVNEYNPAKDNIEEIRIACLRARDIIRQLLIFGRKDNADNQPIDICSVALESMKLIRSSIPSNIKIKHSLPDKQNVILGNATQINQLLINLCSNSMDAMLNKTGEINVSLYDIDINNCCNEKYLTKVQPGRYIRLIVSDNGCGMDEKMLKRIFEPYYTTKGVGKGSGIGLAVVHGIVESHSGEIFVESTPGKGTEFSILIPVLDGKPEKVNENEADLPTGNERILFIDDECSIVSLGIRRLSQLGYAVKGFTNPLEALEIFRTNPYDVDLVITDMSMPEMTGDQLVREVLKIRPGIPTIVCTGYSENILHKEAGESGISFFAMKPMDKYDFAVCVRNVLDEAEDKAI